MAKKLYDLAVKVGTYTDKQGQQKNEYRNVGVVIEGDKGPYLLLDRTFNPAGVPGQSDKSSVIVSMFAPKPKTEPAVNSNGDEIPF